MSQISKPSREVSYPEFPFEEFSARKQKAMDLMAEHGLDGLLIFNQMNMTYYAGYRRSWTTNWPQMLIFSREGRMALVVPQIMDEFSKETTWVETEGVRPYGGSSFWGLEQDPIKLIVKTVKDLGLAEKTIGVETGAPNNYMLIAFDEFEAIKKELPQAKFVNAVPMIWRQRMIKTPWEQDAMRKLADISVKGVRRAIESARLGMTERELLKIFWHTCLEEGACDTPMAGDMMFRGGATKNSMSTPRQVDMPLTNGQQMFFDGGASYKGYHFDFQRHLSFGEPPDLHKRLMEIAEEGQAVQ